VPGATAATATTYIGVAANVTGQVAIQRSKPTLNPYTGLYGDYITVTNAGPSWTWPGYIQGSLDLWLTGLPAGTTVADASVYVNGFLYSVTVDYTNTGVPYLHVPSALVSGLSPGQSLTFQVDFSNPSGAPIMFGARLFSDPYDA
jgi:hypothetical protein